MVQSHRFGCCEVRPVERRLLIDGQPVALGARAFDVLLALIERRGVLVTKDELLDAAWPGLVVEEANVQVQVSALRKVLGRDVVATVPGLGYRLAVSLDGVQGASPAPATTAPARPLLGRDADLQALRELLRHERLVSIVGPGGIGKTALARALWSSRSEADDVDDAWVDLAPLADSALVPASIWHALRLGATDAADPLAALLAALQSRRLLLVLDNAEHLVDSIAHIADAIHERAPAVRVLVTSQSVLRAAGEQVYRLGPLSLPPADAPLDEALRHGALVLFERRARGADRSFALDEANVGPAVQLCRRLDGVPLAIELAAARVNLLGLQGVAQRLDECLRLLGGGPRDAPARQRTLHAALQWSHGLLSPAQQMVFRRCAVFVGGFSLDLLEAVAAEGDDEPAGLDRYAVVDALGSLVDRSLVVVDAIDPPRYRLLEPARLYALERLREQPSEADRIGQRHAGAMRELFERADREWLEVADAVWRDRYSSEIDNLRAAIDRCAAQPDQDGWPMRPADMAVALAGASSNLFWHLELSQELRQRLAVAYGLLDERTPALVGARLLRLHAAALARAGQLYEAIPLARRSLELARSTHSTIEIYQALWILALWSQHWARPDELLAYCDEMCRIEDPAWPPKLLQAGSDARAFGLEARGDLAAAWQAREQQIELARRAGSARYEAIAKYRLAELSLSLGRIDDAVRRSDELVHWASANGQRRVLYVALSRLAAACVAAGDTARARTAAEEFLSLSQWFGGDYVFLAVDALALLAALEGRWRAAARLLGHADEGYALHGGRRAPCDEVTRDAAWRLLSEQFEPGRLVELMAEGARLDRVAACKIALSAQ